MKLIGWLIFNVNRLPIALKAGLERVRQFVNPWLRNLHFAAMIDVPDFVTITLSQQRQCLVAR
jgi:hypothetical protein